MTTRYLFYGTGGLLVLLLTACASAPSDPSGSLPYRFQQRYRFSSSPTSHLVDFDHDGRNELLTYGQTGEGPYALTLHKLRPSVRPQAHWQLNSPLPFSFAGSVDLDLDRRDELCISLVKEHHLLLKVYNQPALEGRWTATVAQLQDTNGDGKIVSIISVAGTTEINGDGHLDLISRVNTGFDLTPRGVVALDGQTGVVLWSYPMGAWPSEVFIQDLTGDGQEEILIAASAPGNGAIANETDDLHSYLIVLDRQGRLLWQHTLGGIFTNLFMTVADVNGDRIPEVITILRGAGADPQRICLWNGQSGHLLQRWNTPWSVDVLATADLNNNGRHELLVGTTRGLVAVLDGSLRTILEYRVDGAVNIMEVRDFDRDGWSEVYCQLEGSTLVLDHRLNLMAELKGGRFMGLARSGTLDEPFSFLFQYPSNRYALYDLRRTPLFSRLNTSFLPYAGVFILGVGITAAGLLLWFRRSKPPCPAGLTDSASSVFSWATIAQTLAHELKSPLNVMTLTLQRLMQKTGPDHTPAFTVILEEIDRLQQRANAFMRFVDCAHLKKQRLDINAFLRDWVAFYQQTVLLPVEMVLKIQDDLPAVCADPEALEKVFENLLENAIAALDGSGQITITTRSGEGMQEDGVINRVVVIEVMDTGVGIPEAQLAKVFEPTFTTKPSGTGFGLPIARYLIETHDGTLDLRSREGVGTIVEITLPAAPEN